ncbi:DUF1573 domain-containing protein [Flavobacterium selenitireducens]|uniref:DUF1573 domain-containing protein n=1 Tax=Flavobacterium selenitireducens TaxID=2722704 RepID=UPI00168B9B70|nr:DUF1573 domain-containing protein [Flavobacterium selenitireducens]MBD3583938.1 DUF1573 domain-containing protein [Flavobacterium selenitireducens]
MKKIAFAFALCSAMAVVSCKDDAASKIDPNAQDVPVSTATPNPEANIGGPDLSKTKRVPPADGKYPALTFEELEHDFGKIVTGDKVTHVFKFKNTGEADLIISKAYGTCGCTVPEYPKEPLKPGASGEIKVSFNSSGKHGNQSKSVILETNTEKGEEKLKIHASIVENKTS